MKYGGERLVREMLDILDNFERALSAKLSTETIDSFRQGIELTGSEFKAALKRMGVTEINPEGEAFNPMEHEAIGSEESSALPAGHVLRVFKKAYKLHDRLIRPAQVLIAKEPTSQTSSGEDVSDE